MREGSEPKKQKRLKPGKPPKHPRVLNVETGETFDTYTEAAKKIKGNRVGVSRVANGLQRHHHGFHFRHE